MVQAFSELREEGRLPIRVYGMLSWRDKDLMNEWLKRGPWVDPEELKDIKVIRTWVAGKVVSEN